VAPVSLVIESGLPKGSKPPFPGSEAVGLTPMLAKPVSENTPSKLSTGQRPFTFATDALVNSAPPWHFDATGLAAKAAEPSFSWSSGGVVSP